MQAAADQPAEPLLRTAEPPLDPPVEEPLREPAAEFLRSPPRSRSRPRFFRGSGTSQAAADRLWRGGAHARGAALADPEQGQGHPRRHRAAPRRRSSAEGGGLVDAAATRPPGRASVPGLAPLDRHGRSSSCVALHTSSIPTGYRWPGEQDIFGRPWNGEPGRSRASRSGHGAREPGTAVPGPAWASPVASGRSRSGTLRPGRRAPGPSPWSGRRESGEDRRVVVEPRMVGVGAIAAADGVLVFIGTACGMLTADANVLNLARSSPGCVVRLRSGCSTSRWPERGRGCDHGLRRAPAGRAAGALEWWAWYRSSTWPSCSSSICRSARMRIPSR